MGNKTCFKIGFMEDEYPILLLDLAITLINDCTLEQLVKIPRELLKEFIKYLSRIWAKVHKHTLTDSDQESEKLLYLSSIRPNNLAETLFRLSMEEGPFATSSKFLDVKRSIFHLGQMNFESFIINHWEESPLLITKPSNASSPDNIFNSFLQLFTSKDSIPSFLASLLQNLVSTPPISSDELDIITFLKESREEIGCPIIYQQDIRVLKTLDSKIENHFLQGSSNLQDIASLSNAFNNGYTFALRGMEFHFQDFASISQGLSFLFGQPSTGVNMYLTPPNSQGLARHYDDHCVLVCQIQGVKRWKVFPNLGTLLPRLYSPIDDCIEGENENDMMDGCKEYLLREGDILYIPRGFPHEACTIVDDVKANEDVEYSLHLTLAIEIEPPFEWEGFIHVALHHWCQNYKSFKHSSLNLDDVAMHLMHIAIKSIGDIDPTFRKACLVGGISYQSVPQIWLQTHQQLVFHHLISKINSDSNFKDITSNVVGKHEDIFENFRWLDHLDKKMPSIEMEDIFHLLVHEKEKVEAAFMMIKSEFCNKVVLLFDDVVDCYNELLEKYRRTRKHYINGMLALNCSC